MNSTTIQTGNERPALTTLMKVLLGCGIVSSLLYVGGEVLASMSWQGYSYVNQAVSELAAIGAPTRPMMVLLFSVYNALVLAFAVGVWGTADNKRSLRVAALALVAYAVVGQATTLFSPMHLRGSAVTATDIGHMALTAAEVLSVVLFMSFGSSARGKGFRIYSIATILVLIAAGAIVGAQAPQMTAAATSTPWAGILERVNIYATMLWVLVLAVTLLRGRMGVAAMRTAAAHAIAMRGITNIVR